MSIQGALNQLIGSTSALVGAGTYLYSQSGSYRAKKAESSADKLLKGIARSDVATDREGEAKPQSFELQAKQLEEVARLREEAYALDPTTSRLKKASMAAEGAEIYSKFANEYRNTYTEQIKRRLRAEEETIARQAQAVATKSETKKQFQVRLQHLKGGKFDG